MHHMPEVIATNDLFDEFGLLRRYFRKLHSNVEILWTFLLMTPCNPRRDGKFCIDDTRQVVRKLNLQLGLFVNRDHLRTDDQRAPQCEITEITQQSSGM